MFPLLSFPNDILISIIEAVDHRPDLIALTTVCKRLQFIALAELCKSIRIHKGVHAQALATVLLARPVLFNYVREIDVAARIPSWEGIEVMPSLVRRMSNLRSLRVESPHGRQDITAWWVDTGLPEYMRLFDRGEDGGIPLANLQSCKRSTRDCIDVCANMTPSHVSLPRQRNSLLFSWSHPAYLLLALSEAYPHFLRPNR